MMLSINCGNWQGKILHSRWDEDIISYSCLFPCSLQYIFLNSHGGFFFLIYHLIKKSKILKQIQIYLESLKYRMEYLAPCVSLGLHQQSHRITKLTENGHTWEEDGQSHHKLKQKNNNIYLPKHLSFFLCM